MLCVLIFLVSCFSKPIRYNTKAGPVADKLNVHIVSHTHDDVGWLKTVDQYLYGANNSIQTAGVQYILDSVTNSLEENPDRKFIYVESGFFSRWWAEQTEEKKASVRALNKQGRLEFINGGWCMDDEASPYYVDMIDQQTIGHQFLLKEFGPSGIPTVGWQIDPFGHSSTQAVLYALMGMDAWYFGRIDYQDRAVREANLELEVVMQPSDSLGSSVDIFTGVMRGYGPISGFNFDWGSHDAPMQDDEKLHDYNIQDRVNDFVAKVQEQGQHYRANNIMLSMGSDFQYANANSWFKNLDKLIHYVNLDGRVNVFYSTPSQYTKSKRESNVTWPTKQDDWFPYADNAHAFWTGYFTSRPALKRYVRDMSNKLQMCRQLELLVKPSNSTSQPLWEAMGVAQHHDAVSGTSKQHVAFDYAQRLSAGGDACKQVNDQALNALLAPTLPMAFYTCPLANVSICGATTDGGSAAVVVYNTLGQAREEFIRLPVLSDRALQISSPTGETVPFQLVPIAGGPANQATAVFKAQVGAAGYSTYLLSVAARGEEEMPLQWEQIRLPAADVQIENSQLRVTFDGASGRLSRIENKVSGVVTVVNQSWYWYNSSTGNNAENKGQASGAYIFRPNCTEDVTTACDPFPVSSVVQLSVSRGNLTQEVRQVFSDWISQSVRLNTDEAFIEVEYSVGPVPVSDGLGKEVVSRWATDIKSASVFYTDSNGREIQTRTRNSRPTWTLNVTDPVSGNFYPVNSAIFIKDSGRQFSILTDRSQAGASLRDGMLELMVHRRLLVDDRRGVGEPLNEPGEDGKGLRLVGRHRIVFDTPQNSPRIRTAALQALTFQPELAFTPFRGTVADWISSHKMSFTALSSALPPNLHLLTAMDNSFYGAAGSMILRLAHLFEVGVDPVLSKPVQVDLSSLFTGFTIKSCLEVSLTANQAPVRRLPFKHNGRATRLEKRDDSFSETVSISPMEIRTFLCDYSRL